MSHQVQERFRQLVALALAVLLGAGTASAGLLVRGTQGITMTGVDGIVMTGVDGSTMNGVDGLLTYGVNGITMTGVDGNPLTRPDGITMTGVDGTSYTGPNSFRANSADGITMTGVDGITMTGVDGITMTGVDGQTYTASAVVVRESNGITMTGVDGIVMTGVDGLQRTSETGITMTGVDGITMTGVDVFKQNGSAVVNAVGMDGRVFSVVPDGITMTGVDGITMTGVDGIVMTGVDGITMLTGVDAPAASPVGLQGVDEELALQLDSSTDDSNINAVVTYHDTPTELDLADLQRIGVTGGTRFRRLPMVVISATPAQIEAVSRLSNVRSIWGNRTLQLTADTSRAVTGVARAKADQDLKRRMAVSGRGIGVAVIDTGLDTTHADIDGRARNVKLADAQGLNPTGFSYPVYQEGLPNTDQASGHGTFVGGIIAGNGARSNGKYTGVAPEAHLVSLGAGDLNLFYVLTGFDYLLERASVQSVRVVNCSFSANTPFNYHDPVNVATKLLTEQNLNVVFSAGNTGPGLETLNPYAAAPWVISVGATDAQSRLADFSSRGSFGSSLYRPTLVAPGVDVVSLRSIASPNSTGAAGLAGADAQQFSATEAPFYTTAKGTSFSAPQVAGVIALMLQANPSLMPVQVRDILQRTATPLPNYYAHEVGAGMLNAHAAVLEAAFPSRRAGMWRAALDRGQVSFGKTYEEFEGTVAPGSQHEATLAIPDGALFASVQIGWGPFLSTNDLAMKIFGAGDTLLAHENDLNLTGLAGKRERAVVASPAGGAWRVQVWNTLGVVGTTQDYAGVLEVARADVAPLADLGTLSAARRGEIERLVRSFRMFPSSDGYFRPNDSVSRADLAAAFVYAGRVPQYLPGTPTFTDVTNTTTMNYVESAQSAPGGALFQDAAAGGAFRPDDFATRLTAAVALVRAAGLRAEAENHTGVLTLGDTFAIPAAYRKYVAVAISRGLLSAQGGNFNPNAPLTRADLAHALVTMESLASK